MLLIWFINNENWYKSSNKGKTVSTKQSKQKTAQSSYQPVLSIGSVEQQPDQKIKTSDSEPQPNTSNIANQQSTLDDSKFGDKLKYSLLEFDENIEKIDKLNELIGEIDRVETPLHFAIEKGDYECAKKSV